MTLTGGQRKHAFATLLLLASQYFLPPATRAGSFAVVAALGTNDVAAPDRLSGTIQVAGGRRRGPNPMFATTSGDDGGGPPPPSWWGRGGPPQRMPAGSGGADIIDGDAMMGQHETPSLEGNAKESGRRKQSKQPRPRRTTQRYKHLYRRSGNYPHANTAGGALAASKGATFSKEDPVKFLETWGYSLDEVLAMTREFPPLASSLDVAEHLEPKLRFLVETLEGGVADGDERRKVSNLGRAIPPQYFGCRLEKNLAPRHAYLVHRGLPHGRALLEDGARLFREFLSVASKSNPATFAALCNRWDGEHRRMRIVGFEVDDELWSRRSSSTTHTVGGIQRFERAFRRGLLAATRSELTEERDGVSSGDMVQLLIGHGANPHEVDTASGASLLHWAAGTGNMDGSMAVLDALVRSAQGKEDASSMIMTTKSTKDGATPLHWACSGVGPSRFGTGGHPQICLYFLQQSGESKSALINAPTATGNTPLMWASWAGSLDVVNLLARNGADPTARNDNGCTAAHWASSGGDLSVCRFLHEELGVDFTEPNDAGNTPLHHAVTYGRAEVVDWITSTLYRGGLVSAEPITKEGTLARRFVEWKGTEQRSREAVLDLLVKGHRYHSSLR